MACHAGSQGGIPMAGANHQSLRNHIGTFANNGCIAAAVDTRKRPCLCFARGNRCGWALFAPSLGFSPIVQGQRYEDLSKPMTAMFIPPNGTVRKYIYSSQQPYREAGKSGNWKLRPIEAGQGVEYELEIHPWICSACGRGHGVRVRTERLPIPD